MNRAKRRAIHKQSRKEEKFTYNDVKKAADRKADMVLNHTVNNLMSCFALTLHNEFGFGQKRILYALESLDRLMGMINNDDVEIKKLIQELEDTCGIKIE